MDEYSKLKSLLVAKEQEQIAILEERLTSILEESRDPEKIIEKISPLISSIFAQTIQSSREEFIPIFSPLMNDLLKSTIKNSSGEIAKIMAPLISLSIKEQVKNESDEIVDALYPVMGNMISKFVAESFKEILNEINSKVQSTFSIETLKRKITAKVKGVSEAELLLQSSSHLYKIQNVFLIHKESGILVSERSIDGKEAIEPDMVASMLTAIKSFANDWIAKNSNYLELNEIEFGNYKIRLEVAGCCYLAIVLQGEFNKKVQQKIVATLEYFVKEYSSEIANFGGDTSSLALEDIHKHLDAILELNTQETRKRQKPQSFLFLWLFLGFIIGIFAYYSYNLYLQNSIKKQVADAIYQDSQLNIYNIKLETEWNRLLLKGRLPAESLHTKLLTLVPSHFHNFSIKDEIVMSEIILSDEEKMHLIKKTIDAYNFVDANQIHYHLNSSTLLLEGTIETKAMHQRLMQQLSSIKGVNRIVSQLDDTFTLKAMQISFSTSKVTLNEESKIQLDRWFHDNHLLKTLKIYKNMDLLIIGYTDAKGDMLKNVRYAEERALHVKVYLHSLGVPKERMKNIGAPLPPEWIDLDTNSHGRIVQIKWLKNDN